MIPAQGPVFSGNAVPPKTTNRSGRVLASRPTAILLFLLAIVGTLAPVAKAEGARVSGVVNDISGGSIAGADIRLTAGSYSAQTSTDASGAFSFDGVPAAAGTITVDAKGFSRVQQSWTAVNGLASLLLTLRPAPETQQVVVTAARTATPLEETPLSVMQLTSDDLRATPALTLDDSLRQVPGFSLFRRSSSRIANPTTMGVSLRGLGSGSGTSRALAIEDGIPLADPFGSWIYWGRVPEEAVSSVEVVQEGASSLYGSSALGGVIQFLTKPAPPSGGASVEVSYGNQNTPDLSLWSGGQLGRWESTFSGDLFHTDGYILVPEANRGTVDTQAGSQHGTADWMIGRKIGEHSEIFGRGWYMDDTRKNGTPDTKNGIRLAQGAIGANLDLGDAGSLTLRFYGVAETYNQTFSSVAANRDSEILTDIQAVPAQGVGGSALWTRHLGMRQQLVAGFDEHEEIGHSNERIFSGVTGAPSRNTFAGGHQLTTGLFGEDLIQIAPRWTLTLSARFDDWRNLDAESTCVPIAPSSCPAPLTIYPERSYDAFDPRAALVHSFNSHVSWSASVYRAFRAPTLNELYRSFRQGTVTTDSNAFLRAERLTGMETGVDVSTFDSRLELRGTFFYNQVVNPVANVPCTSSTPNCVLASTGTTQIRENLGRTSAPGVELDGIAKITRQFQIVAGYQYVDAKVISSPGLSLTGLWVAQIPHNVVTFQARYTNPGFLNASLEGRMVGAQFDDAPNKFLMGRYFVLDATASRAIGGGTEVFGAVENLADAKYLFALQGVPERGLPIAARFGFRYEFPRR
ncbi:MAG TPA: TonB-dependent receptor [Verrucomicrobiae bacterium]|nr:TonB-dependent receptor [Verrucomicrobiae bacterium]